jgi:hypothetical protein
MDAPKEAFVVVNFRLSLKIRDALFAAAADLGMPSSDFLSSGLDLWLSEKNKVLAHDCICKQFKRSAEDMYKGCLYLPFLDIYSTEAKLSVECSDKIKSLSVEFRQSVVGCASMLVEHVLENWFMFRQSEFYRAKTIK